MQRHSTTYHIEPLGRTVIAKPGVPLMRAAVEAGLRWPTICGGLARCGVCHVRVIASTEKLPPPTEIERKGLRLVPQASAGPDVRLACQLVACGVLTVSKAGVEPK
jgi:2Fe-2S ferredoxin